MSTTTIHTMICRCECDFKQRDHQLVISINEIMELLFNPNVYTQTIRIKRPKKKIIVKCKLYSNRVLHIHS